MALRSNLNIFLL